MTTYTPTYHPQTRSDRILDWFEANAPVMLAAFSFGALMTGAALWF